MRKDSRDLAEMSVRSWVSAVEGVRSHCIAIDRIVSSSYKPKLLRVLNYVPLVGGALSMRRSGALQLFPYRV